MQDQNSARVAFANTLRGIASVSVLIGHYTGSFWAGSRDITANLIHAPALPLEKYAWPIYLIWLHTTVPQFNWGAFGVALFFLVSGFVIPASLRSGSTWQSFLVGRFFRIVPLYVCGFSVTLLSIWLVGKYFGVPWPFSLGDVAIQYLPGPRELFWVPSIDGIVWTLEIEIKFYLVCALAIVWMRRRSMLTFAVPLLIFAGALYISGPATEWAIAAGTPPSIYYLGLGFLGASPYLVFMFIGTAFFYLHAGMLKGEVAIFLVAVLFVLFAVLLNVQSTPGLLFMAWSYAPAVIVFAAAASFPHLFRSTRLGDFFADISFPLYVTHGVAGYIGLRILLDLGVKAWLSLIIVTAGALGVAWILHVVIEEPSHRFGKRLAKRLAKPALTMMPQQPVALPAE